MRRSAPSSRLFGAAVRCTHRSIRCTGERRRRFRRFAKLGDQEIVGRRLGESSQSRTDQGLFRSHHQVWKPRRARLRGHRDAGASGGFSLEISPSRTWETELPNYVTTETAVKLNHVNLPVADVSATREFFEKHFGFDCIAEPTTDNVVLTDNAGLVLTISNFDHVDEVTYPKWFHVGFMQDSDDKVDEIYDRLKTAGMPLGKPRNMHGAHTFYFTAPGGFTVEVFHQRGVSRSEGR